ncbi:MAG TPA: hypothetical protein VLA92_02805 [Candidatus Saccharimonadales bacterium]|nr:hypothetical protein [Candidatus Saccharimonadales bacterium]
MNVRKYRWSKHYESAEEELLSLLQAKNIQAERWEAEPMEIIDPEVHPEDRQLWCAEGSIIFTINNQRISIQPGDALDIPANTFHEAVAGISGCVFYEYAPSAS